MLLTCVMLHHVLLLDGIITFNHLTIVQDSSLVNIILVIGSLDKIIFTTCVMTLMLTLTLRNTTPKISFYRYYIYL